MDPNRPTEQQQAQAQADDALQRRRQAHPASSQSNMAGVGTSAGHSDAFIPFPELGTMRTDVAQSSVPVHARRVISLDQEYDVEARFTSPQSIPPQRVVTPDRPNSTNTANSSSEITSLPPAMVSSRRNTTLTDSNPIRTLHNTTHSNLGSTVVPQSRRSLGPDQLADRRSSTMMRTGTGTDIDWIVPVEEKSSPHEKTVAERLEPTLLNAIAEKTKYATKARLTGYALNAAIGLQVLLGSLTTALSVVTKGSQTAVMTAVLGGFTTVVASYLARARGSNEPELSITRVKDLEQFIRECEAFKLDHGHATGGRFYKELENFRGRFEELLGNANGERRLSPV